MNLNKIIKHWFLLIILFVFLPFEGQSQFKLTDASKKNNQTINKKSKALNRISLPFIDDFSNYLDIPNPNLWNNNGGWVNRDYPFLPPTIGVLTLDALNSEGQLYPLANTTGFSSDTVSSCFIRLDSTLVPNPIPLSAQDSIFLSFYVQPGGGYGPIWENIGSTPSKKDSLVLQFYCLETDIWNSVWKIDGLSIDSIYAKDSVYWLYVNIPIIDSQYFSNSFRFRFLNFASLDNNPSFTYVSNCDQWHIDYVYLNKDRKYDEKATRDIAFVNPAYSLLKEYQSMPAIQFMASDMSDNLNIKIVNLADTSLSSNYKYEVRNSNNTIVHSYNGGFENISSYIKTKEFQTSPSHSTPPVGFAYEFDNNAWTFFDITHTVKQGVGQDNNAANDTIRFRQTFENYFAYDDGTAENGFGIEPIRNANLAVGFDLNVPDTLMAVDIYFNSTYEDANQKPFFICVWNSLNGQPRDSIYHSYAYLTPSTEGLNQFTRYYLERPVILPSGESFISIQTKYNDYLNVGFDRNTDASSKMFGNWANSWEQNTLFKGSLMLRPYFGYKATIGITEIEKKDLSLSVYPNPTNGILNISLSENEEEFSKSNYELRIANMIGMEVYSSAYKNQINVSNLSNGVYILYLINKETSKTIKQKLIIQK